MTYRTISTYIDVDVDLDEFETDDLIEELESRGVMISTEDGGAGHNDLLVKVWELRRLGRSYDKELDQLIYNVLGKTI